MTGLILGGVVFADFEIPNTVNLGGKQQLAVHKLLGGGRVIDAMGGDPDQITWAGRFRGPNAITRAQAIDEMRMAGAQIDLAWLSIYRSVVVSAFKFDTEKAYEIPYQITCEVVLENAAGVGGIFQTIDTLVSTDMTSANAYAVAAPIVAPIVAVMTTGIQALGPLVGASGATRTSASAVVNTASVAIQSAFATEEFTLGQVQPTGDPNTISAWLVAQANSALSHSGMADTLAYVNRIGNNIAAVKS